GTAPAGSASPSSPIALMPSAATIALRIPTPSLDRSQRARCTHVELRSVGGKPTGAPPTKWSVAGRRCQSRADPERPGGRLSEGPGMECGLARRTRSATAARRANARVGAHLDAKLRAATAL